MNQAGERLSELKDKVEYLKQISKGYKNLTKHWKGTYRKCGAPWMKTNL